MRLLSSEGLSQKDTRVLKSMVDLLSHRTNHTWRFTDEALGEVVLLDIDNLDNPIDAATKIESQKALVIEYTKAVNTHSQRYRIQKPLRASALIALLNLVGMRREGTDSPPPAATEKPSDPEAADQSPGITFLNLLAREKPSWLRVSTADAEGVVDLVDERFHLKGGHMLHDLFLEPDKELSFSQDSLAPTGHGSGWVSLPHLKWRFGITLSRGELCEGLSPDRRFKLTRWPPQDIARSYPHTVTFSALLSRKAGVTIDEMKEHSGMSSADAIGFINGAYLAGSLSDKVLTPDDSNHSPPTRARNRGLFKQIRARLGRRTK